MAGSQLCIIGRFRTGAAVAGIAHDMGENPVVRILSGLAAILRHIGGGQNLSVRGINISADHHVIFGVLFGIITVAVDALPVRDVEIDQITAEA